VKKEDPPTQNAGTKKENPPTQNAGTPTQATVTQPQTTGSAQVKTNVVKAGSKPVTTGTTQVQSTASNNDGIGVISTEQEVETCPNNTIGAPVNGNCECIAGYQCFDTHVKDGITEDLKEFPNSKSKEAIKKNLNNQTEAPGCAGNTRYDGQPGVSLFHFSTKCKHCQCRKEKAESGSNRAFPSLVVAAALLSAAFGAAM
jgi:hypothetical protein